jgi:hypothetical protein
MKNLTKILVGGAGILMLTGIFSAHNIKNETIKDLVTYATDLSVGTTLALGAGYKLYRDHTQESDAHREGHYPFTNS